MRAAILVETPRTGAGLDFVKACRKNNIYPIIFIKEPSMVPEWVMNDYTREEVDIRKVDTYDICELVGGCNKVKERYELVAVISLYEYSTVNAAKAAEILGLKTPNCNIVKTFRDKSSFRKFLFNNKIRSVKYQITDMLKTNNIDEIKLEYPVVVKPVNLTGSAFVRKCNSSQDVANAFKEISELDEYTGQKVDSKILVEEFISGQEYSVEVLNGRIVAIVRKYIKEPGFIECGHDLPASITEVEREQIENYVHSLIIKSNYNFGLLHIELKVNESGVFFIEANPRVAGGRIPELIRKVYGIDIIESYLLSIVGEYENSEKDITSDVHASIRFTVASKDGVINDYTPLNIGEYTNLLEYKFYKDLGIPFTINYSNKDRIAHVIAVSESIEANERIINQVFNDLNIKGSY